MTEMRNAEHYHDPTAGKAVEAVDREQRRAVHQKARKALSLVYTIIDAEGFEPMRKIELRHIETGVECR